MGTYSKKSSIFAKILLPMFIVAVLQSIVFLGFMHGGIASRMDQNSYNSFSQLVENRRNEYQNQMNKWMDLSDFISSTETLQKKYAGVKTAEAQKDFLSELSPVLVSILRQNKVNGAFFILTDRDFTLPSGESPQSKYGVCVRDLDPNSGYKGDSDILVERAPASITKEIGFALDSWWEATYSFADAKESAYYYEPLLAALQSESKNSLDYLYWSQVHQISKTDTKVISCSVPVFDEEGVPFGVLGIELTTNYLQSFFPSAELNAEGAGVYVLAQKTGARSYVPIVSDGYMYPQYFENEGPITISEQYLSKNCAFIKGKNGQKSLAVANIAPVQTYNSTSRFSDTPFALLGTISQKKLLNFSSSVRFSLILAAIISLLLSLCGAFIASKVFSAPIKKLVGKVKHYKGGGNRKLGRVNIREIDELIQAIETLNGSVSDNENKISEIIRISGLLIGTFEIDKQTKQVFIGGEFFVVMGDTFLNKESMNQGAGFSENMQMLDAYIVSHDTYENTYVYHFPKSKKWVRLKISDGAVKCLGIVLDISNEMQDREKIEYERDHDVLTELLNRRAFHHKLSELFQESEKLEIAAMIMMDVDNLKYVNDNFGHDYGDRYLRTVAGVLKNLESKQRIVARISGDEFMMFLYGYQKKEEIIDIVQLLHTQMAESFLMLPNAEKFKIRISGGVAWYPDDSREQNSLIKFADFTMLQTKKNHKGHFDFFAREEYRENRYLVESVDEINHLIDEELVDYFFQPIVNIKTGVIYAHEALMRPYGGTITSPAEALSLARAIGSLYRMERLTWLNSLRKIQQHLSLFGDDGVFFINSIPNQHLSPEDYDFIVAHYAPLLKRTVVEITEDSQITKESQEGFDRLRACGVRMAIDDYGTGFNGQALLLDFQVDYLKIDMSIVRDVSADLNRQDVIQNLVLYGGERGIKIIAEGVETREELETLYRLGVEYVQGFLLQKPSPLPCSLSAEAVEILKSLSEESARKE